MNPDLIGKGVNRNTKCTSKTKVSNFEFSFPINEQLLIQISDRNLSPGAECDSHFVASNLGEEPYSHDKKRHLCTVDA